MTSEEKLGFDSPIEHQCPKIDTLVKAAKEIESAINHALKCDDVDDMRLNVEDADWYAGDIESGFEELRDALDNVRQWGQQWKELAKELIEEYEPERLKKEISE